VAIAYEECLCSFFFFFLIGSINVFNKRNIEIKLNKIPASYLSFKGVIAFPLQSEIA
jgi:hypothetical protein